jgi:flavorubredoxin
LRFLGEEAAVYKLDEIAPDLFRISVLWPEINLQFNHFLVRDAEPLLYHAGLRRMFPDVREAVSQVIDPGRLRWISFSHFEADECGALNQWLALAPQAQAACPQLQALLSVNDFALRPAREMAREDVLSTGKYRFRYIPTPHVPHGWDACACFEETQGTLLCSDLFHHNGDVEPITTSDIVGRVREALIEYQHHPLLADYMPYTHKSDGILRRLAELEPRTLATMHGSSFAGDCQRAFADLRVVMREILGAEADRVAAD